MSDNTVQFRLTVTGASESEAAVQRVRTDLSGVIALMLASNAVEHGTVQTTPEAEEELGDG